MFSNLNKLIVVHFIALLGCVLCNDMEGPKEFFTSIAGLEDLLTTEIQLQTEMQKYIDTLTQHIELLRSEMTIIQHEHWKASKDLEGYLNNPINAYRLIKRLFSDWPTFEESVMSDSSRSDFLINMEAFKQNLSFPTQDDMVGSTRALMRLQQTYNLDVAQVASGILNGMKYGSPMTWQDCFIIGEYMYAMSYYNHTIAWFKQTTKLIQADEQLLQDASVLDFMETLIEYYRSMGDYDSALDLSDYIIARDPERKALLEKKAELEKENIEHANDEKEFKDVKIDYPYYKTNEYRLYERVCRGEHENTYSPQQKYLFCQYHTNGHPYLLLQPLKLEQLSLDPYVIYVHDVLTDIQMEAIKDIAKPRMTVPQTQ
uniref:Uncharacterized protein n=1 Tax=Stomoxys calcitrans TaxID=35570 RepID=A0A1I8NYV7_STOCA